MLYLIEYTGNPNWLYQLQPILLNDYFNAQDTNTSAMATMIMNLLYTTTVEANKMFQRKINIIFFNPEREIVLALPSILVK